MQADVFATGTPVIGVHANKPIGVIHDVPAPQGSQFCSNSVLLLAAQFQTVGGVCSNCAKW